MPDEMADASRAADSELVTTRTRSRTMISMVYFCEVPTVRP